MRALVIARRELFAYLLAPVAWLVAALFVAAQGYSFWLFVALLNGHAAHATALRFFFGGSLLYWVFVMLIAAALTMRLLAEESRSGTLEPLCTAPVSPATIVIGKYLGAWLFYLLLWLPTLLLVAWLTRQLPAGQGLDPGPIVGGYLGTLLVGSAALAVGLLASAATQHQLAAAALGFLPLLALLLAGVAGDTLPPGSPLRPLLDRLHLMRQMDEFGRGLVDLRAVVLHLGLVVGGLWGAALLLEGRPGRRVGDRALRSVVEGLLVVALIIVANLAAAEHPRRLDLSRHGLSTLSPRSEEILRRLSRPVTITVLLLPTGGGADPYDELRDLLELLRSRSPLLDLDFIGEGEGQRANALAEQLKLDRSAIEGGAVVLASEGRVRVVTRRELARFEDDPETGPRLVAFTGEAAIAGALLALTHARPPLVCASRGHGELAIDSLAVDGMADLGAALKRDGTVTWTLPSLDGGVPRACDALLIAGPSRPFAQREVAAVSELLDRGGRLLVLLGPSFAGGGALVATGLEDLLGRHGVEVADAVAIDPRLMSQRELAWAVDDGYGDHPITASFPGRRTVWTATRPLAPRPDGAHRAVALVRTSDEAWGERDLTTLGARRRALQRDPGDLPGPLTVAVAVEEAGEPRLVALGSAALARNDFAVGYNRDLVVAALEWLTRRQSLPPPIAPHADQIRLRLDDRQLGRLFLVAVVGLPLVVLLVAGGVFWRRRR